MTHALVQNGEVQQIRDLPDTWRNQDGTTTSGFDLLPAEKHRAEGWLPVEDVKPSFDEATKRLGADPTLEIREDRVVRTYKVEDRPVPPPTFEDRLDALAELTGISKADLDARARQKRDARPASPPRPQ